MPTDRRTVADALADDAHALLAGAECVNVIAALEYRIQDLQEISDDEDAAAEKAECEKQTDTVKT